VDFNITALTNDVPLTDQLSTSVPERYFSFVVSSNNAYEATFQLLQLNGNADLVVSQGAPLPTLTSSAYGSFTGGNANENIYVLTNSTPVPLSPGTWYLGVFNRDTHPVNYTVVAQELDLNTNAASQTNVTYIQLTNNVPFNFTSSPGAALTNFFYFVVSNTVTTTDGVTVTNSPGSIQFQLFNLTGNGDLTVQTDAPPFAPPFFQSSQEPGTRPEFILIQTNNVLTNLATTWYLGVPDETSNSINYTILATINTNGYFPAFPGAGGAGGGALGGSYRNGNTNNTVYHVVNLNDSGPGSLRDAVSSTNRTIVFDISGVIYLQTNLFITNSYLTIAGQTAPEGGITIAGAPVVVSTYAHDDVIRFLRLRPNYGVLQQNLFVSTYSPDTIYKYTPSGVQSTFATGLSYPFLMAFDSSGNLFVANSDNDGGGGYIGKITPAGVKSTFYSGLDPKGLIFTSTGNLLETDYHSGIIYQYTPGGVQSTFATGFSAPQPMLYDSAGNLYISDGYGNPNGRITKITPGGIRTVFASGLNSSPGIAINSAGDIFAGDQSGNIYEYTPTGTRTTFATGVSPEMLAFNNKGILFESDNSGNIYEFTTNGTRSTFASGLFQPVGVTFQPAGLVETGNNANSLLFQSVSNIIVDHLSLEWANNDNLAIAGATNITVQWSVISDGIGSPSGSGFLPGTGGGSFVSVGDAVSLHHNLYADNNFANPQIGPAVTMDFDDNIVYDWGVNAGNNTSTAFTNYLNYICNYFIASTNSQTNDIAFWSSTTNDWIFQKDNFIDSDTNHVLNGANTRWNMFTNVYTPTNQFSIPPVGLDEAYLAYEKVLDFAGVNMFHRDAVDSNIVEHVRQQNGNIITVPGALSVESTNLIYQYSTADGIPDFWKITFSQAVTNSYNNVPDSDGSGYSELEEFDNWLAGPHALTMTNNPVGVNLQKLFGKTGNLSFYLTNAIHGTVYLTNVLGAYTNTSTLSNTIAIFTPTNDAAGGTNYYGYASFDVYVTNNDTVAYFGPVTVSVLVSAVPPAYSEQAGPLAPNIPITNSIGPNTIIWYLISVPTNAIEATNTLITAGAPMNLWYSSNSPPTTAYPNDFEMLAASTNGSSVIDVSGAPFPPVLPPGGSYYLGVQNTNNFTTNYAVEVNFYLAGVIGIILNPGQPVTNTVPDGDQYYTVPVPPNAIAVTNTLLFATNGSVNLLFNQTNSPNKGYPGDVTLISEFTGTMPTNAVLITNGVPPLIPAQPYYYLDVNNNLGPGSVTYAIEVTYELYYTPPILPVVTNQDIIAGNTLTVNDQGTDTNAGSLFYYLTTAPPVSATISNTGLISWIVPTNNPGEDILFTTVVSNSFTLQTATNSFTVTVLPQTISGQPQTNIVVSNNVNWLVVNVPINAEWATNILLFATNLPVNVLFTTNFPPNVTNAYTLMFNQTNGVSVLNTSTNTAPTNIVSGETYYIGIQNNNSVPVGYSFEVNFGYYSPPMLPAITNLYLIAGTTLEVTNTAADTNSGALSYSLATSPSVGATISTNGIITWATTTNQSPGNYIFTTVVTNSFTTQSATNAFTVTVISPLFAQLPQTNTVAANSIDWQVVKVPANALLATNILLFAHSQPVNVLFTANYPPMTNGAYALMSSQSSGVSILSPASVPTNIVPGGVYYLGVQNTNSVPVNYALLVNFAYPPPLIPVHLGITYTNIGGTNGYLLTWFAPTNDIFQVQEAPGINPPVSWNTFSNVITYPGPLTATNGRFSFFDNGSEYSFGPARFYRLLLVNGPIGTLPNGQPQANTLAANSINWVAVDVPTNGLWATNLLLYATNLPVNVLFTTNSLQITNGAYALMSSQTNGISILGTSTAPTNIIPGGIYYLGVQNTNSVAVNYALEVNFGLSTPSSAVHVGITYTNISGRNGFLLTWFAPSNDTFQVQETPSIMPPVVWNTFSNIITDVGSPTPSIGLFSFFDNGSQYPLGAARYYRLLLVGNASNTLVLPALSNYVISVSQPLTVTNTATDSNLSAILNYNLSGYPTPAPSAMITTNGIITWTPALADAGTAFTFTTIVSDNGVPPASATNAFTVFVLPAPAVQNAIVTTTNITLRWSASTNDLFKVEWTSNIIPPVTWNVFPQTFSSASGQFTFTDTNTPLKMKFYRLMWLPPP
jgi:hypothetical protein